MNRFLQEKTGSNLAFVQILKMRFIKLHKQTLNKLKFCSLQVENKYNIT